MCVARKAFALSNDSITGRHGSCTSVQRCSCFSLLMFQLLTEGLLLKGAPSVHLLRGSHCLCCPHGFHFLVPHLSVVSCSSFGCSSTSTASFLRFISDYSGLGFSGLGFPGFGFPCLRFRRFTAAAGFPGVSHAKLLPCQRIPTRAGMIHARLYRDAVACLC